MTALIIVRHAHHQVGQADGHGPWHDQGLSPLGRAQAEALRARLAGGGVPRADLLISSTLRRARETAAVIAPALGLPVTADPDLDECRNDDGTQDAAAFQAYWDAVPEHERGFRRFAPGCETVVEFNARLHTALHRLVDQHAGRTLLLVAHGGTVEASFQFFFGFGLAAQARAYPAARNTALTHWRQARPGGPWALECFNDDRHLPPAGA